jgi:tetratricopeptide (TPR) repeat protein
LRTAEQPIPSRLTRLQTAFAVVAIFAATLAAYFPALRGGLLWDDAAHITAPRLQAWGGLWLIWSRLGTTQQYYPVLHSAFWLEHRIWGGSVVGYHLVNAALHATSACLFALVLARIRPEGSGRPGAEWLAAAVFALHPVCAESVAWISEQKNTLSLAFYLLAALAYLRFERGRVRGWYLLGLGLFAAALLSKSVTATLPAALLLVIALRRGTLSLRRDVVPLLPWFVVGISSGLFTAWVERTYIGASGAAFDLGFLERCLLAGRVVWFYLWKLVWPRELIFIYPRWHVALGAAWILGTLGVLATVAVLWGIRRWSRGPLVAFLFFVGSLFPALGFLNVYPFLFSYVADHFQYLACLGIIALVADGGASLAFGAAGRLSGGGRRLATLAAAALAVAVLATLFVLTWRQSGNYRDAGALYADTLAKNPVCWMADNNLGVYFMEKGALERSIAHLEHAVKLKPDYADAHNNLGNALVKVPGNTERAVSEFEAALRLEPHMAQAHANLGFALVNTRGRETEGIGELATALLGNENNPDYAQVHADLGAALAAQPGRIAMAKSEFEAALRLAPDSAGIREGFGLALARAGRPLEAVGQFEGALRLRPYDADYHNNLGSVLMILGRGPDAVAQYREAIRLNPRFAGAHFNLGRALRLVDDVEAIAQHREAIGLNPGSSEIWSSLGTILYRLGRLPEALPMYREAVRLEPNSAQYHFNLGACLAAGGERSEAIGEFRRAVEIAPGYSDAHFNLALELSKAGHGDEAEAELKASGHRP